MTVDVRAVHGAVDGIVLDHGAYLPIELLLTQGRLDYQAYEAWRYGTGEWLEDALLGNVDRIRAQLEVAAAWARKLGLQPTSGAYEGWGPKTGKFLVCARNEKLNALLCTVYRRSEQVVQPDLFLDGGEAALLNDLRGALSARNAEKASMCLDEWIRVVPEHRLRASAERLCDALDHLSNPPSDVDPALELERLQGELSADGRELLGPSARDFEAPFWRRLANALAHRPFDAGAPELHASYALERCLDWHGVRDSVLAVPAFDAEPGLLLRLINACSRLGERTSSIEWLMTLCWRHPETAAEHLENRTVGDRAVLKTWETFCELDVEPVMDTAWFPAWLLIAEPGLARVLNQSLLAQPSDAFNAFDAVRTLLTTSEGPELGEQTIAQRQCLRDAHPALLAAYLKQH